MRIKILVRYTSYKQYNNIGSREDAIRRQLPTGVVLRRIESLKSVTKRGVYPKIVAATINVNLRQRRKST